MKRLISIVTFAVMSFAVLMSAVLTAPKGGDNDSPYNMPNRKQIIQTGDLGILVTAEPQTVTLTIPEALVEIDPTADVDNAMAPGGGAKRNVVPASNGTPGGDLVSEWQEQDGTTHRVVTIKGSGESVREFIQRHRETVVLMKEAFPPCPHTG